MLKRGGDGRSGELSAVSISRSRFGRIIRFGSIRGIMNEALAPL
jgi:hypothetical protein